MLFDIAGSAFVPPPKVTSSLVSLVPREDPLACDRRALERMTEAAFGQRRKMLRQSLQIARHRSACAARRRRHRPDRTSGGDSDRRVRRARTRLREYAARMMRGGADVARHSSS